MKALIPLLALALCAAACQKKTCWVCSQREYTPATGFDTVKVYNLCDKTRREVRSMEQETNKGSYVDEQAREIQLTLSCK